MARPDRYIRELQKIATDKTSPHHTKRTRAEIEADIASISEELKGSMPNVFRLDLVEARTMKRKQLAKMNLAELSPPFTKGL